MSPCPIPGRLDLINSKQSGMAWVNDSSDPRKAVTLMGESRSGRAAHALPPSHPAKDTTIISIAAWRIVMILALLAFIAAALLVTAGITGSR
jgi:hypothetical protein